MYGVSYIIARYYNWAYELASPAPLLWGFGLFIVLAVVLFVPPFWLSLLVYLVLAIPFFAFGKAVSDKMKTQEEKAVQMRKSLRLKKQMSKGQRK